MGETTRFHTALEMNQKGGREKRTNMVGMAE